MMSFEANNSQPASDVSQFLSYDRLADYMQAIMDSLSPGQPTQAADIGRHSVIERIFHCLTRRQFCYLSKSAAARYYPDIQARLSPYILEHQPLHFFFDIGGGYRASLRPGIDPLTYNPSLGELFVLHQIAEFDRAVRIFYKPGIKFTLVIDNLCAFYVNDIPLSLTESYCTRLRRLIDETDMQDRVDILKESSICSPDVFTAEADAAIHFYRGKLDETAIRNIGRFLGRQCDMQEAEARKRRYIRATATSDVVLAPHIDSVRMTQRASENTFGFRSFPGGAARIQVGQVALAENELSKIRPVLITSENIDLYDCNELALPSIVPRSIGSIFVASSRYRNSTNDD